MGILLLILFVISEVNLMLFAGVEQVKSLLRERSYFRFLLKKRAHILVDLGI